ncbi:MAG: hypothetical protein QNJ07_06545 [Woeseiaceae bacterium]|nr:hypothetical protein [Woeseiaceae bacterium]
MSRPDTGLPVDVRGEVRFHGPSSREIALRAEGSKLFLALSCWSALTVPGWKNLREQRRALATSIDALKTLCLSVDVNVDGHRAFEFGEGVKTTLLARMLGLNSADIRLATIIRLLRSRAAERRVHH